MPSLTALLPGLACAGGMVLCMWLMRRGMAGHRPQDSAARDEEVAALRDEVARLRSEQASPAEPVDG